MKEADPKGPASYDNLKGFKLLCDNASHLKNLV